MRIFLNPKAPKQGETSYDALLESQVNKEYILSNYSETVFNITRYTTTRSGLITDYTDSGLYSKFANIGSEHYIDSENKKISIY